MTSVVLRAHVPCVVCGYRRPTLRFASIVVNVKSLREKGTTLVWAPGDCRECGWKEQGTQTLPNQYRLDAEDQAKVDAIRARRRKARAA